MAAGKQKAVPEAYSLPIRLYYLIQLMFLCSESAIKPLPRGEMTVVIMRITGLLSAVHFRDRGEGGDLHRTDVLAGEGFGTAFGKILFVGFRDGVLLRSAAGGDQVAVVGECRAVEGFAALVVGTNLQTQPAFEAFSRRVHMRVLFGGSAFILLDIGVRLFQVFLDDPPIDHEVADGREFSQRLEDHRVAFEILQKGFARERGLVVDHHGARAAHPLQTGTLPLDPSGRGAADILEVIFIVQLVEHTRDGLVFDGFVIEFLPVRLCAGIGLSQYFNSHSCPPYQGRCDKRRYHR